MYPKMHISVNLSYVQLRQPDITWQVLYLLEQSGLPGEALTCEVTESMQLQYYQHLNQIFYRWKQAGIEISVDDFGTGYSSLGYLKNLEIDEIEIDRSFVRGIQNSAYNYRLLNNMIGLAHSSLIRVCCEGTETPEELTTLLGLGPDLLQGFLFGKPLSAREFERTYFRRDCAEYQSWEQRKSNFIRLEQKEIRPLSLNYQEIFKSTCMGLWRIRIAPGGEVFEFNEAEHSIRFRTKRTLFAGDQLQEENFPACWIGQGIVHPHFASDFSALFHDVTVSEDGNAAEVLLRSKQGAYEWFRICIRHFDNMGNGDPHSILVFLNAADRERVLWLENMRIRDFYRASLSEAIAYAEVDLESCQLSCFRRQDLVGRMGGDEFLVFLKGLTDRSILDRRIEKLNDTLQHYPNIPLNCSAGILFVDRENFSYQQSLQQVDEALYRSKEQGKGRHTYAGE